MIVYVKKIRVYILLMCVGILAGICLKPFTVEDTKTAFSDNSSFTVVCDAGHGEPDGGAVGASGTLEKDINLAIAEKTAEVLEKRGMKVIMTRTGDNGIYGNEAETIREKKVDDMHKRLEIINNSNADLFISIHMNSFTNKNANGVHVFYNKDDENLKEAANMIKNKIGELTQAKNYDIKPTKKSLYLMKNSTVPAVLVECGFLSNIEEEKKLNDEKYQAKIAWAIADSIIEYFNK